jgi:cell division protein FtsB
MSQECPLSLELQLSIATDKIRTLTAQNRKLREQKKALIAEIEALKGSVVVE